LHQASPPAVKREQLPALPPPPPPSVSGVSWAFALSRAGVANERKTIGREGEGRALLRAVRRGRERRAGGQAGGARGGERGECEQQASGQVRTAAGVERHPSPWQHRCTSADVVARTKTFKDVACAAYRWCMAEVRTPAPP
jgi:hypothetical protein